MLSPFQTQCKCLYLRASAHNFPPDSFFVLRVVQLIRQTTLTSTSTCSCRNSWCLHADCSRAHALPPKSAEVSVPACEYRGLAVSMPAEVVSVPAEVVSMLAEVVSMPAEVVSVPACVCRGLAVSMGVEDFSSASQWKPFAQEALQIRQ